MILVGKSRAIHMHMIRQNPFSKVYITARYLSYSTLLIVRLNIGLWIHTMKSHTLLFLNQTDANRYTGGFLLAFPLWTLLHGAAGAR